MTIKKISHLSGFSTSTVSKALRNSKEISTKTKGTIQKIAKNNNYIPNRAALALRSKNTKIIALLVPKINSLFFSNMISKIQFTAFENGYRILILETFFCEDQELECLNTIRDGSVDGVIIVRTLKQINHSIDKYLRFINKNIFPVVVQTVNEFAHDPNEKKFITQKLFEQLKAKIDVFQTS